MWDLCSVQAFVILPGRQSRQSRAGDKPRRQDAWASPSGWVTLARRSWCSPDRIRVAAMLGDLPQVEALGPQIVDIGERGGLPWRYFGHVYLGLAAHWRGHAERAEAELRNAVELEPPGAFAGQSVAVLARHFAYHGRADEVMELFKSAQRSRRCPASTGSTASGRGAAMLGFVEALYLCGLHEEAAALSPLLERTARARQDDGLTFDGGLRGDPCRSRRRSGSSVGGSRTPLRHRPRGRRTNAQPARAGRLVRACTPGCCWIAAAPATASAPPRCSRRRYRPTVPSACLPTPPRPNAYCSQARA